MTLTPTDALSGAAATYYTTNGTTPTTASTQGTSIALTTAGTYTIKYFSVDAAGNAEPVKTAGTPDPHRQDGADHHGQHRGDRQRLEEHGRRR